jgi:hypothetical protein
MVTADRIAGRLHIPRFGALRSRRCALSGRLGLADDIWIKPGTAPSADQKPGNVIADD